MKSSKLSISQRNIKVGYFSEFFRSLIFLIPIWAAFELRYIDYSQMVIIEVVLFASQFILELPTGALADLLGKKITIFLGLIISGTAFIIFSFSDSFSDFLVFSVLFGLGEALISGSIEALYYDSLKEDGLESNFDKILSKFGFIFQIGLTIATLLGGILSLIYFRLPGIINGLVFFIAAFISLLYVEPSVDSKKFNLKNYIEQTKNGFKEIFKDKYVMILSLFYGLIGGVTWSISIFLSKIIVLDIGMKNHQIGVFFALIRIFNAVFLFWLVNKTNFINRKNVLFIFTWLVPLFLIPAYFGNYLMVVIAIIASMFFGTARFILLGKYTNKEFSSENRSVAISSLSMIIGLIYIASIGISSPLIKIFGSSKIVVSFLGVFLLFTTLPLGLFLMKKDNS